VFWPPNRSTTLPILTPEKVTSFSKHDRRLAIEFSEAMLNAIDRIDAVFSAARRFSLVN
jgi:hypothetical protein